MPNWKKVILSGSNAELNEITSSGGIHIESNNNGNRIFTVSGSNGQLVTVTDEIGQSLFQVNNLSGITHFEVSSSGTLVAQNLSSSNTVSYVLTYNSASVMRIYFASSSDIGGSDNLGNHTAEQALDMAGFDVNDAGTITGTKLVVGNNGIEHSGDADTKNHIWYRYNWYRCRWCYFCRFHRNYGRQYYI